MRASTQLYSNFLIQATDLHNSKPSDSFDRRISFDENALQLDLFVRRSGSFVLSLDREAYGSVFGSLSPTSRNRLQRCNLPPHLYCSCTVLLHIQSNGVCIILCSREITTYVESCSLRLQIGPTSVASCQHMVGHIFREMADDPAMIRYAEIKGCASASLLLENGRREQIMAWTFLMSKLSHNLGYTPLFTCEALQSSEVTSWLNMIATEAFWITSFAEDPTCSDADHGCLQEGSQRTHTENCKPEDWRLCESAMTEERAFVTNGFYQAAREVSVQGFSLVKGILDLRAEQLVEEVYLSVLRRRADESGLTAYTTMIASGGTAAQVAESLKRSEEYINLSGKMDKGAVAKATETVFKDMLLRAGEDSELGGFIDLFNDYVANGKGVDEAKAEMQRILRGSKEYRDVCEGQVMTCDQGKTLVKSSYRDILERDPDHGGLVNYARELVTGQMTEEVLRRTLQESSEYRDILSFRHSIIETVEIVKKR